MIVTIVRSVILSAVILLAMWFGSLWVYDSKKTADALEWRWAELNGEAVYSWPFDIPVELTHGHGFGSFKWLEGILSGDHADPYFYLNLKGRIIDADRFTEIRLRLNSQTNSTLRLFHFQGDKDLIHASKPVPVTTGWQSLTLSLPELNWQARHLSEQDGHLLESSWGGASGIVSALRIDPVENGAFEIDWIELIDSANRPQLADEIETFQDWDDELFERMRQDPARTWHIAQDNWLRTPETSHRLRLKIARAFPSAIVFPRPPTQEELAYPPFEPEAASSFIPASIFIAALLFFVVRDQVPGLWRSIVAVIALFSLVGAYVYWVPGLSTTWRILLAIPMLGAMWEMAPKSAPRYLFGDARAWQLVSPFLVVSVLVILLTPTAGVEFYSIAVALLFYFLWALFQQFVVAVLIYPRLKPVFGKSSIYVGAGLFGLMHFPNFALMVVTFLLGIIVLIIYKRHQNLVATAAAQAFVAVGFNTIALQYFWLSRTVGPAFGIEL